MSSQNAEFTRKLRAAVRAKLEEYGLEVDEELPDYVMIMVGNKKDKARMKADLKLFLGDNTSPFVDWLFDFFQRVKTVTSSSGVGVSSSTPTAVGATAVQTSLDSHKEHDAGFKHHHSKRRKSSELPPSSLKETRSRIDGSTTKDTRKTIVAPLADEKHSKKKTERPEKAVRSEKAAQPEKATRPEKVEKRCSTAQPAEPKPVVRRSGRLDSKTSETSLTEAKKRASRREEVVEKEKLSSKIEVVDEDDTSPERKVASKIVVMRHVNKRQILNLKQGSFRRNLRRNFSQLSRGSSNIFKRAISEAASVSANYARPTARKVTTSAVVTTLSRCVNRKALRRAHEIHIDYDADDATEPVMTKKRRSNEDGKVPRLLITYNSTARKRVITAANEAAKSLAEADPYDDDDKIIVRSDTATVAGTAAAQAVVKRQRRQQPAKLALLAAAREAAANTAAISRSAPTRKRSLVKRLEVTGRKLSDGKNEDEEENEHENHPTRPVKSNRSSSSSLNTSAWDCQINLDVSSSDDEAEIDALLASANEAKSADQHKILQPTELPPPTAVLSLPSALRTAAASDKKNAFAALGYNPVQYQTPFTPPIGRENPFTTSTTANAAVVGSTAVLPTTASSAVVPRVGIVAPPLHKTAVRCRFWPDCRNEDVCPFHHPSKPCNSFPNCWFGESCLFIHPPCKFGIHCYKPKCAYTHYKVAPPAGTIVAPAAIVRPAAVAVVSKPTN